MKEIKDYLHLYLGCECVSTAKKPGIKRYILSAITIDGLYEFKTIPENFSMFLHNWKPVLRPLSDMTELENGFYGGRSEFDALEFAYLLKQGFDLFGLIESGLAIDKTKL